MLKIVNITKQFKKKSINPLTKKTEESKVGIFNISFEANKGRIYGLVGANGAGKTTAMRIISQITFASQGEIFFNGKEISKISNYRSLVSFVSGETQPYDRLTPYETISIFGSLSGINNADLEIKIKEISDLLEMNDFLHASNKNFSTGMKQKISIARSLITNPEIFIFDEITNGLDIFAHESILNIILELKKQNKIIIFSTHNLSDADEICDDIALLDKGKILLTGSKNEVLLKNNVSNLKSLFFKVVPRNEI